MPQIPLFDQPQSTIDQIRELWSRTTEADRMAFLEEVRRAFLFRTKPAQALPDGQRKQGVA